MKLPAITLTKDALLRFDEVIEKEWLITNGLGGYASSTALGINTRKYHGLLVAALHPPGDRTVCLSKLDEDLLVGEDVYRLGANEFHDTIYPKGYKLIDEFSVSPFPTYKYNVGGVGVSKTVFMLKNKNAVSVIYKVTNKNSAEAKIKIYPLLTCRYFHNVINQSKNPLEFTQQSRSNKLEVAFQRPEATIICRTTSGTFKEKINLVPHLHYRDEASRGEADTDDCFQPGFFEVQIPAELQSKFAVTTAVSPQRKVARDLMDSFGSTINDIKDAYNQELRLNSDLLVDFFSLQKEVPISDWLNWILLAADSFVVKNGANHKSIIAGYYWFEPWGRDTFISLPGLLLVTGRFTDARNILENFIGYCSGGLIPNLVDDKSGEPVYNTVDGTLWYVNAVLQYLKYTGDFKFVQEQLWENLQEIIENHEKGTLFDIRLDSDGLLSHGSRLTWMDAVVEGEEITPRTGKAVDIQALWFNTLKIMELLAVRFGERDLAEKYSTMANKTRKSFNEKYWNPQLHCLFDVVGAEGVDASLRPNQIFPISLDFSMLDIEKSRQIVDVVNRELVTPYGLRTLALDDPKFVGKCFGDRRSRDTAYHNGTIWPWLLGPHITAYLKVNEYNESARKFAFENFVVPLFSVTIHQAGLGTVSEIFDCDPPNLPRGCIAQAWSVAEPLRAYVEDVLQVKPKHESDLLKSIEF